MKMRHPGCHHMMAWQLTATMVRGAMRDACPPFTGHQRDQLARQMVPEVQCDGWLAHWPARGFALGTTSIATQGITSGPGHRATTQLGRAVCGNVFVGSLGAPSLLAQQNSTATRHLGWSGAKKLDDTRAEGLMLSVLSDTQPRPTASGGGVNALSSWGPRYRSTNQLGCAIYGNGFFLLPGHQFWPGRPSQLHGNWFVWWPRLSEDTVLRGSRFGHLQARSPLGDRRWRGLLVKALGM